MAIKRHLQPRSVVRLLLAGTFAASPLGIAAFGCNGQSLDVGETMTSSPEGSASTGEASTADGPPGTNTLPEMGLSVDGTTCASTITGAGTPWPSWKIIIQGDCGSIGVVRGVIDSSAIKPYPQSCSAETTTIWGVDNEGEPGTLFYGADNTRGNCTLDNGPSLDKPNASLIFKATVTHARDPNRTHQITYRGESNTVPVVLGQGDAGMSPELDADADSDADGD